MLESLAGEQATLVFYEAPHRILDALADIVSVMGRREIAVARELTKLHEETLRGTAAEILAKLSARDSVRGEFVVMISKATEPEHDATPIDTAIEALIGAGTPRMDAIKQVARQRGLSKRDVYDRLLREK
jgi:16S rRNA (cytidine1402-2'-O)-methyltransferase